jgi:hypothetical protein
VSPPPPPPVVVTPPAPTPPPPTHALVLAPKRKPKPHRRHPKAPEHVAPAPAPISRGAGGPAPPDLGIAFVSPVAFHVQQVPTLSAPPTTGPSRARLFFLAAIALGFVLVFASALPGRALRPAFVYEVVAVHRLDLVLVGSAIVVLVGALYLLTG